MLPITTPRLVLRSLRPEDAQPLAIMIGNWNVIRWLSRPPFPYTLADAEAFIIDTITARLPAGCTRAAITRDEDLIGIVSIEPREASPELGYWLGESHWGNGYMSEAAAALVARYFAATTPDILHSGHFVGNHGSACILARLGFEVVEQGQVFSRPQAKSVADTRMTLTRTRFRTLHPEGLDP